MMVKGPDGWMNEWMMLYYTRTYYLVACTTDSIDKYCYMISVLLFSDRDYYEFTAQTLSIVDEKFPIIIHSHSMIYI